MHMRAYECPGQFSFPVNNITGEVDLTKGRQIKEHSNTCIMKNKLAPFVYHNDTIRDTVRSDNSINRKVPTEVTIEMHVLAEDLALSKSGTRPEVIYWEIKQLMDEKYNSNWYGMQEGEVKNLIKNTS